MLDPLQGITLSKHVLLQVAAGRTLAAFGQVRRWLDLVLSEDRV